MIKFTEIEIEKIITHRVGNKFREENYSLTHEESQVGQETKDYLLKYFFSTVKKEELFSFSHVVNQDMNTVYTIIKEVFSDLDLFIPNSQNIAKLLYEQSIHPKIKEGQLNVAYFRNAVYEDELVDAIGIFKSETALPFLQMDRAESNYNIIHRFGFDLKGIDKGCLIFNTSMEDGYRVLIIDQVNKSTEAQYWKDDFLNVRVLNNEYHQTNEFLGVTKDFITQKLPDEFELNKADKIDLLNRSVDYFKENTEFNKEEFENSVFEQEEVIQSFRQFEGNYKQKYETEIADNFEISSQAVKKQARKFKSVLKLDKNFHIYIHGDRNLIEQGVDDKGRKYYKIYYEHES